MPLNNLGQFPQKADSSPQVMEVSGDISDSIKAVVAQLRFSKIFVRWFNAVASGLEDELNVKLFEPVLLANPSALLYTSTNFRTNLQSVVLTNVTGNQRTVTLWVVPNGASADNPHQVLEKTVSANSSVNATELTGLALENNEQLYGQADQASAVSIRISGTKQRIGLAA